MNSLITEDIGHWISFEWSSLGILKPCISEIALWNENNHAFLRTWELWLYTQASTDALRVENFIRVDYLLQLTSGLKLLTAWLES